MTCRNPLDDIKTGLVVYARDEPGGSLCIGQVVSGMKVARAWVGLLRGRREPALSRETGSWSEDLRPALPGKAPSDRDRKGRSPDARRRGGPSGSSVEGPVMGLERSGRVIQAWLLGNRDVVVAGGTNG